MRRTIEFTRCYAAVALVLTAGALAAARDAREIPRSRPVGNGPLIGDADGDGDFDRRDVRLVELALTDPAASSGSSPQSDVGSPCGVLDHSDLDRLTAALRAVAAGRQVPSECHGDAIGLRERGTGTERLPTLDEMFLEVALRVEEFGGMFVGPSDSLIVVLTDTRHAVLERATAEVIAVFGRAALPAGDVRAVRGDYGFGQLMPWRIRAQELFDDPQVTFLDADELRNRIVVGVAAAEAIPPVRQRAESLDIPAQALQVEVVPSLEPLAFSDTLQKKTRPLIGGVEIYGTKPCTLGFLARRNGVLGMVTNSHCTSMSGVNGDSFAQGGQTVATEMIDPPWGAGLPPTALPFMVAERQSDSAFLRILPGITAQRGVLARSPHVWPFTPGGYTIQEKSYFTLCGQLLNKVGRTTGETRGEVTSTCCDEKKSGAPGFPPSLLLSCQHRVELAADYGDSGSPVFKKNGTNAVLHGLLWGGGEGDMASFSPIAGVENELGFLDLGWADDPPAVRITLPKDGATLYHGGVLVSMTARAEYFDREDGDLCDACGLSWNSNKDGLLADVPGPGGIIQTALVVSRGTHVLTAKGWDSKGHVVTDSVTFTTGNEAPWVKIEYPSPGEQLYRGVHYVFEGASFDNDMFQALPDPQLTWSSSNPADYQVFPTPPFPVKGHTPTAVFHTNGVRQITLVGKDGLGAMGDDQVQIVVVDPPLDTAPLVTISNPAGSEVIVLSNKTVTLQGYGKDPDGKSPIQYRWTIVSGGAESTLGESSAVNGALISLPWTPPAVTCKGDEVELRLYATDADGDTGFDALEIYVFSGSPC